MKISKIFDTDSRFETTKKLFRDSSLKDIEFNLWSTDYYIEARNLIDDYIDRYGFRCIEELKLETVDLYDDPSFALNAIKSYLETKSYNIEKNGTKRTRNSCSW